MTQIRLDETFHYEFDDDCNPFDLMTLETRVMLMSLDELANMLDYGDLSREEWSIVYKEYNRKDAEEQHRYYEENIDKFTKFESELKAKVNRGELLTADEANWYSDWHKDMYGYRPRYDWLRWK